MNTSTTYNIPEAAGKDDDQIDGPLPGFRFHPTDEELVSFYLRRKVEKNPIPLPLIQQIDIYRYNPWDLPETGRNEMGSGESKEGYYYCKRGRKYKNSIRPNRVTGSGFWKATGIDKPVYSHGGDQSIGECIGLKKTLVYYRGSAGKGTKTDWMMHEFRLPTSNPPSNYASNYPTPNSTAQEAEIWTLCRIFQRTSSYKRHNTPNWRSSKTCSVESDRRSGSYINFTCPEINQWNQMQFSSMAAQSSPSVVSADPSLSVNYMDEGDHDFVAYNRDWDELGSAVEFAFGHSPV